MHTHAHLRRVFEDWDRDATAAEARASLFLTMAVTLAALLFAASLTAAAVAPTVEIAPSVLMPMIVDGCDYGKQTKDKTNYTTWFVDTAWSYFNQGNSLRAQKVVVQEEIFLQTKIECMGSVESTIAAGEYDLAQLGMDYVDLLLIHTPYLGWGEPYSNCSQGAAGKAARQATWRGMEALQRAGKAKAIGVSNFNVEELQEILEIAEIAPAVNQAAFCVGYSDNRTIGFQRQLTPPIVYQAYSPLGGSDWDPSAPTVMSIAAKHNRTAAQVGLRYMIQCGSPLATASLNPQHLADDLVLDIFDWELSAQEMAVLNSECFPKPPP